MDTFVALERIEDAIITTCEAIKDDISDVDDEGLQAMMEDLAYHAFNLNHYMNETDEWTCFDAALDTLHQLQDIYQALRDRLLGSSA